MKFSLTLIATCFFFSAIAQNNSDTTCIPGRTVLPIAVQSWKAVYQQLANNHIIGSNAVSHSTGYISISQLTHLLPPAQASENGNCEILNFWIYMDSDTIPKIAISREGQSDSLITLDNGGQLQPISQLSNEFNRWVTFTDSSRQCLIYVQKFRYEWSQIEALFINQQYDSLSIEFVAHSVSPLSTIYELPDQNVEGWITLDIILQGIKSRSNGTKTSSYFDFAMPCPKNCPNN